MGCTRTRRVGVPSDESLCARLSLVVHLTQPPSLASSSAWVSQPEPIGQVCPWHNRIRSRTAVASRGEGRVADLFSGRGLSNVAHACGNANPGLGESTRRRARATCRRASQGAPHELAAKCVRRGSGAWLAARPVGGLSEAASLSQGSPTNVKTGPNSQDWLGPIDGRPWRE